MVQQLLHLLHINRWADFINLFVARSSRFRFIIPLSMLMMIKLISMLPILT
jgi:hypothetical protein